MSGKDVRRDVVVVRLVLLHGAVVADKLSARLAVQLKVLAVPGAAQNPPLWREHLRGIVEQARDGNNVV